MTETSWYGTFADFSTILTPILLLVMSVMGWAFKTSVERTHRLEQEMREDRLKIYRKILEPLTLMFTKDENSSGSSSGFSKSNQEQATKIILSKEYREAAFDLTLFANDEVVRAFNALYQTSYTMKSDGSSTTDLIFKMGDFYLSIRKSVGNETTNIKNHEMLRWMINDIDNYIDENGNPISDGSK